MRRISTAILLAAALVPGARADEPPAPRPGAEHAVPLYGTLVRDWDAPEDNPYAPGHRGLDVAAAPGTPVRASADGVVSFAGAVAGNRTVTVDHAEGVKTSYSYLADIQVTAGAAVLQGQPVGTVGDGHPGSDLPPHVHLSVRIDDVYVDPVRIWIGDDQSVVLSLVG